MVKYSIWLRVSYGLNCKGRFYLKLNNTCIRSWCYIPCEFDSIYQRLTTSSNQTIYVVNVYKENNIVYVTTQTTGRKTEPTSTQYWNKSTMVEQTKGKKPCIACNWKDRRKGYYHKFYYPWGRTHIHGIYRLAIIKV